MLLAATVAGFAAIALPAQTQAGLFNFDSGGSGNSALLSNGIGLSQFFGGRFGGGSNGGGGQASSGGGGIGPFQGIFARFGVGATRFFCTLTLGDVCRRDDVVSPSATARVDSRAKCRVVRFKQT
jgi:hypothetical protein